MTQKLLSVLFFLFSLIAARATVYYVSPTGNNASSGTGSWANAKQDVQAAINAAAAGDEIWVKAGTYLPTLDPNGGTSQRNKTFYIITKDVKLYGGFAGIETLLTQRNPAVNITTLSGDLDGASGTNDAYHVLVTINRTSACVVDGFTISGGRATGNTGFVVSVPSVNIPQDIGGGMYNSSSSPAVSGCTFSASTASNGGGGMYNSGGSPAVRSCTFSANTSNRGGGDV